MSLGPLLLAGALLSVERACYVWIARAPGAFRAWATSPGVARLGEPVAIVEKLFYAFKVVQLAVFIGWCYLYGGSLAPSAPPLVLAGAAVALVAGQILIMSAFYQLGRVAVFFGDRLGHEVPWCWGFPFSLFPHPQYFGTVVSIWAFFVAMRFPHPDWYLLPALETAYYAVGAVLEERGVAAHDFKSSRSCPR